MKNIFLKKYLFVFIIILVVFVALFVFLIKVDFNFKEFISKINVFQKDKTDESDTISQYKELIKKGHESYLAEKYEESLSYLKEAVSLQKNDRIHRSLFTVYLAMKNYPEAEKAIQNALKYNKSIPNHWVEYAQFEQYYMNASFEKVSAIYEEALIATKENIDVIVSYASYLVEKNQNQEAIKYLKKAIEVYPQNKDIYQAEIDRLSS